MFRLQSEEPDWAYSHVVREIAPETELTFDYANDGIGDTTIVCKCRSKDCDEKVYRDEDEGGEEGDPTFGKDYERRGFASLDYIAARMEDRGFVLATLKKPKELWKGREGESESAKEKRLALLDRMKLHWRDDEKISKLFRSGLAL